MPAVNTQAVAVWKRRFRRVYASDLPALVALSDEVAAEAGETVSITSASLADGATAGVVTGNKLEMLAAIEEVITELSPAEPEAPSARVQSRVWSPDFRTASL